MSRLPSGILWFWWLLAVHVLAATYNVCCTQLSTRQACVSALTDTLARCAGRNYEGQLGDGTTMWEQPIPTTVQGSHNFTQVSTGAYHTCGVRTDGAALCLGERGGRSVASCGFGGPWLVVCLALRTLCSAPGSA